MHSLTFLLFGPYASRRQKLLVWITGLIFAATILFYAHDLSLGWVWWQYIIAGIVSFDIPAGSVANNLVAVKRHWQQIRAKGSVAERLIANKFIFAALHIIYIVVMGFSFWATPIKFSIVMSAMLLFGVFFVTRLPKTMARSGAISMVALSMLLNIPFHPPSALWWFMPLLVVKVIGGFSTPATT
jgi:hypothetical protein